MDKLYLIRFRTKNPFYATFDGEMSIDSATYAIRRVTAHTSPQVTINHLTEARLSQTFDRQNQLTILSLISPSPSTLPIVSCRQQ